MAVKLQRIKFTDNLSENKRTMYRASVKSIGVVSKDKLADNMNKEQGVSLGMAKLVLGQLGATLWDYMELGHSVQIDGLGTLSLVVSSTATESEADCTAKSVKGVKIVLTPTAEIKQKLATLTFEMDKAVVNGAAEDGEGEVSTGDEEEAESPAGDEEDTPQDGTTLTPDNQPAQGSGEYPYINAQGIDRIYTDAGEWHLVYRDADGENIVTHHYDEGETIIPIEAPEGYKWPDTLPAVMPAQHLRIKCVPV